MSSIVGSVVTYRLNYLETKTVPCVVVILLFRICDAQLVKLSLANT